MNRYTLTIAVYEHEQITRSKNVLLYLQQIDTSCYKNVWSYSLRYILKIKWIYSFTASVYISSQFFTSSRSVLTCTDGRMERRGKEKKHSGFAGRTHHHWILNLLTMEWSVLGFVMWVRVFQFSWNIRLKVAEYYKFNTVNTRIKCHKCSNFHVNPQCNYHGSSKATN